MDYQTVKARVASYLRRSGDTTLADTLIPEFVNEAQDELCRRHRFYFLRRTYDETPVDGQQIYALTTHRIIKLVQIRYRNADGDQKRPWMEKRHIMGLEAAYANASSVEQPLYWDYAMQTGTGQKIEAIKLFPSPNATTATGKFNLYCYVYLPALSGPTDTNPLTDEVPYGLIFQACAQGKFYLEQWDKALEYMAMADKKVDEFQQQATIKQFDDPFNLITGEFGEQSMEETYGDPDRAYGWV